MFIWRSFFGVVMSLTAAVVPTTAIRSPLAKAVYRKLMHESQHRCNGHEEWYTLDTRKFRQHIKTKWIQLKQDEQTTNFLEHCYDKSDWILTQLYHSIAQSVLHWFMTKTSINGLLRRGSMFVFSADHFGQLLHATSSTSTDPTCACAFRARCPCVSTSPPSPPLAQNGEEAALDGGDALPPPTAPPPARLIKTLLDLGAGDGEVTANMAPYFERVFATETSRVMQWRLREKGFVVLDAFSWNVTSTEEEVIDADVEDTSSSTSSSSSLSPTSAAPATAPRFYDVIACLNLLDRCSKPLALLHQIYDRLEPSGGRLVVALVLPFHPYVEFGPLSPEPEERLLVDGVTVEDQINSLVDNVFAPIGFSLEAVSRLPYLCEGDLSQAFYVLEDVVFVFRKNEDGDEASARTASAGTTSAGTASADSKEGFCQREEAPADV